MRRSRQLAFDPGDEGLDPEPSELLAWLRDSRQSDSGQTGHCDVVKADDRKIAWNTQVVAVGELLQIDPGKVVRGEDAGDPFRTG